MMCTLRGPTTKFTGNSVKFYMKKKWKTASGVQTNFHCIQFFVKIRVYFTSKKRRNSCLKASDYIFSMKKKVSV